LGRQQATPCFPAPLIYGQGDRRPMHALSRACLVHGRPGGLRASLTWSSLSAWQPHPQTTTTTTTA